jgi:hypothetical protein
MRITLTCTCGREHNLADAKPGATLACPGCGKALAVPAMGVLATPKVRAAARPIERSPSRRVGYALFAAGGLLLLGTGVAWLIWSKLHERANPPTTQFTQVDEQRHSEPKHEKEDKRPEPAKKNAPAVIPPAPVEEKKTPLSVLKDLVEPGPSMIEPVAQVGELPNPFLLPRAPIEKEPPAKVVEKKPNVIDPLKLVWKLKADDVFFQELVVTQKPTFNVQGIAVAALLQYRIVSRFTVKKRNDDGSLVVEQKIESARLLQADDLTRPLVAGSVAQLPGTVYNLELNAKMDVTKFEGAVAGPKVAPLAGGMGLHMAGLIDRDGWKELAQATFFQFDQPLKVKDRWSKRMTHNWGALGAWSGQIHYLYLGKQDRLHQVGYRLQLAYNAPAAGAVGMLKVAGANFQPPQAEGVLLFDAVKGRVIAAEERFRVRGVIQLPVLGQNTPVEIEEDQHFAIRIHEKLAP